MRSMPRHEALPLVLAVLLAGSACQHGNTAPTPKESDDHAAPNGWSEPDATLPDRADAAAAPGAQLDAAVVDSSEITLDLGSNQKPVSSPDDPACTTLTLPSRFDLTLHDTTESSLPCLGIRVDADECAGAAENVGFQHQSENLTVFVYFTSAVVADKFTPASLRENFRRLWYQVRLPQPATPEQPVLSNRIYVEDLSALDRFELVDGRLHIDLHSQLDVLYRWVEPQGGSCHDDDVGNYLCACDYATNLPVELSLDVLFPPDYAARIRPGTP